MRILIKKIIKSIFKRKKAAKPDVESKLQNRIILAKMPVVYYEVHKNGEFMSYEKNLRWVSMKYPELKRSTLYRAFKQGKVPRIYVKNNYTVEECQKF